MSTDNHSLPEIDDRSNEAPPTKVPVLAITMAIAFVFLGALAGTAYLLLNQNEELPEAPADILGKFGSNNAVLPDYEVKEGGKYTTGEEVIDIADINGSLKDSTSKNHSLSKADEQVPPNIPAEYLGNVEKLQSIEQQLAAIEKNMATLQAAIDKLTLFHKKPTAAKHKPAAKIPRPRPRKKLPPKKLLPKQPLPTPPFVFIGIEIWDGEPKAVITSNGHIAHLSKGETSSNWVLLSLNYPNRAEFMHKKSGHKSVLLSDGRLPYGP